MKAWKHLNLEQRKLIARLLSRESKLCEIADLLNVDATSISKEIKRNRIITRNGYKQVTKMCKYTTRYPYVCNFCQKKYSLCPFKQFRYDANKAQEKAYFLLKKSRLGVNLTPEQFMKLDTLVNKVLITMNRFITSSKIKRTSLFRFLPCIAILPTVY